MRPIAAILAASLLLILMAAPSTTPRTIRIAAQGSGYLYAPDQKTSGLDLGRAPPISASPVTSMTLLVILVDFQDIKHNTTLSAMQDTFFGSGNSSVSSYYWAVSHGQFRLTGQVLGWYTLTKTQAEYGADSAASVDDPAATGEDTSHLIIEDVFSQQAAVLGIIDNHPHTLVVHAGTGQETASKGGGSTETVWSCTYTVIDSATEATVAEASLVPEHELAGAVPYGVWRHELAHQLDLADLYGYDGSPGKWDLMSSGNWLGVPAGSMAAGFSPIEQMIEGWLPASNVRTLAWNSSEYVMLNPLEQQTLQGIVAIILELPDGTYYAVSNRQQLGADSGLPDGGVVIYHVSDTVYLDHPRSGPDTAWHPGQSFAGGGLSVNVLASFINGTVLIGTNQADIVPTYSITVLTPAGVEYAVIDGMHLNLDTKLGILQTVLPEGAHTVTLQKLQTSGDQTRQRLLRVKISGITLTGFVALEIHDPEQFMFDLQQPVLISGEYSLEVKITVQSQYGTANGTGWYEVGTPVTISITPDPYPVGNGTRARFRQWTPTTNPSYDFTYRLQNPEDANATFNAGGAPATFTADWTIEYLTIIQPLDTSNNPYNGTWTIQLYRTGGGAYTASNQTAWLRRGTYHVELATIDQCRAASNQTMSIPFGITAPYTKVPIVLQASPLTIIIRSGLGLPATTDLKLMGCHSQTLKAATGTTLIKQFPEGTYTAEWQTAYTFTGQQTFTVQDATSITVTVITWYDLLVVAAALLVTVAGIRKTRKTRARRREAAGPIPPGQIT